MSTQKYRPKYFYSSLDEKFIYFFPPIDTVIVSVPEAALSTFVLERKGSLLK